MNRKIEYKGHKITQHSARRFYVRRFNDQYGGDVMFTTEERAKNYIDKHIELGKIYPSDVAMIWGTQLENGFKEKTPDMFINAEKYGFTEKEADGIRKWAELQPLARSFKSEGLKRMNEAMDELHAHPRGTDKQREYDLMTTIYRERVENQYSTVWFIDKKNNDCWVLIKGTYDECMAFVAENHLEAETKVSYDPDFLEWDLNNHLKNRKP